MGHYTTIKAGDVRVGDAIYDRGVHHPGHAWVRVTKTEPTVLPTRVKGDGLVEAEGIIIHTTGWTTYKHIREALAVKPRKGEAPC